MFVCRITVKKINIIFSYDTNLFTYIINTINKMGSWQECRISKFQIKRSTRQLIK